MLKVSDVRGVEFTFHEPPRRVVSLVPSLTESLFAIGAGDSIVAVTQFCIFPQDLDRPRAGGTKNPDVDAIRALQPDLVHMNLEENLKRHADAIGEFAPVFVTEPKSVEDVAEHIEQLGAIHGRPQEADGFAKQIRSELEALRGASPFTFACPIWKKPWMWCGGDTYVSNLVAAAGGRNILGDRERYPAVDLDDVLALRPDVVFLPDEPYLFTEEDARELGATTSARVIGPFPGHLFTWHGVRTLEGLRWLRDTTSRWAT